VAIDPDSEVICAAEVSPATSGDVVVAPTLLGDLAAGAGERSSGQAARAVAYGDSAYGTGAHLAWLDHQGLTPMVKTQVPTAPGDRFAKDQFRIDLAAGTVTCPARVTVAIRPARRGGAAPGSASRAASARCARGAPAASVAGSSPSIPTRQSWPPPVPASVTPRGWPTIGPPGPRSSASWRTYSVAATVVGAPACAAWSACPGLQAAGRCGQPGAVRQPRAALHQDRLAGPARLTAAATSSQLPAPAP
jgi:hypothetical protein